MAAGSTCCPTWEDLVAPIAQSHNESGHLTRLGNLLLEGLSEAALLLLRPHLLRKELSASSILWKAGDAEHHVYFPHSGLISLAIASDDGHLVEVASISRESAAG